MFLQQFKDMLDKSEGLNQEGPTLQPTQVINAMGAPTPGSN